MLFWYSFQIGATAFRPLNSFLCLLICITRQMYRQKSSLYKVKQTGSRLRGFSSLRLIDSSRVLSARDTSICDSVESMIVPHLSWSKDSVTPSIPFLAKISKISSVLLDPFPHQTSLGRLRVG